MAVTLTTPAPAGGVTVALKSSDASKVTVTPASVVIPEGATTPPTQPQVTGVGIGTVTITASATGYVSGTGTVTVSAPTMAFTGSPLVIAIGGTGKLILNLTGGQAPAGGLTVSLSSSDTSKATVPGTVSFAAGATSTSVTVTGVAAGTATITASAPNIANATAGVTVTPPPTVTASYGANFLQLINVVLTNTSSVTAVNLRITGVTNVTAVAPNVIALLPNNVIPMPYGNVAGGQAGVRSFTFGPTAGSVEVPFSFTITYEADNMPPRTAVIDVPFPRSMSFAGSPLAINVGASGNLTLNLTGNQAPAGGLTVNLSSNDPSRATVPATVTFAAGASSVAVPVTGVGPGTAVITANATVVNFPATATATVNVTGGIGVPANTTVGLGQSASFAVKLPGPAPVGGVTVTLKSSDPSKVTVTPASVVILQGATTPATQPQVTGAGIGAATITASATGYTPGTGTVTVSAPTMTFTGSPMVIAIGSLGKLILNLTGGQAPAGGLTVSLSSSDPGKAGVPGTVSFEAGETSTSVSVTGVAAGTATITASAPNFANATASVTVTPPATVTASYGASSSGLINVVLTNTGSVTAFNLRVVSVTNVTAVAPNVIALLPGTIVPTPYGNVAGGLAGVRGLGFGATAGSIEVPFSFTINYQADNMPSRTVVINVPFPRSMSFAASPLAINAVASENLTLNLTGNQAPAGGLTVNLSSSDPSRATVPATVTFAAGATSVAVPVTGIAPGSAVITANATVVGFPATTTATVNVTGAIGAPANAAVGLGQSASFAVKLPGAAPAGGVTVALKSSDPSKVTVTPASVVIPAGATAPATHPQVTGAGIGSATITASAAGYTPGTGTVTVTAPTMAFTGAPSGITIGFTGNLTLSLTGGQAPAGGLTMSLTSSDTGKATVPGTVSFAAGATSATVPVTGVAAGTATITASAPNIANATAGVTVTPPPTVVASYAANHLSPINVILTNTSAVTAVNLRIASITNITAAAPNVIALTPNNVFPMPYGTVAGGKAAIGGALFTATAGSLSVPFSFTITYQADNMPSRTAVIDVPFPRSMSFAASSLSINAGASGNLTLNLTGNQAPAGGLTVTLISSDPSRATVPAVVTFPAGATSVAVPVAGLAPGTAVITANATVVNFPATATATVNVTGAIGAPSTTTVGLGQSASFAVKLPGAAPAGGVTVTLKSSDVSKVTVTPASVVIPQGATAPATQPQVTGAGIGAATITASATGYTPGAGSVTVSVPTVTASYGANHLGAINLVLSNTSAVATVNLRITNVTNITAPPPNVIAQPPQPPFPWPIGDLLGGQTRAGTMQFTAIAGSLSVPFSFTVTYQADNMAPRTAVISVPFPRSMSFAGSPLTINAGASGKVTLNLTGNQAPAGGLTVNLSSSNPGRATVPPTVTFPAGATSVTVLVTGIAQGSVVIMANATVVNFPATATATVNVTDIVNPPDSAAVGRGGLR